MLCLCGAVCSGTLAVLLRLTVCIRSFSYLRLRLQGACNAQGMYLALCPHRPRLRTSIAPEAAFNFKLQLTNWLHCTEFSDMLSSSIPAALGVAWAGCRWREIWPSISPANTSPGTWQHSKEFRNMGKWGCIYKTPASSTRIRQQIYSRDIVCSTRCPASGITQVSLGQTTGAGGQEAADPSTKVRRWPWDIDDLKCEHAKATHGHDGLMLKLLAIVSRDGHCLVICLHKALVQRGTRA